MNYRLQPSIISSSDPRHKFLWRIVKSRNKGVFLLLTISQKIYQSLLFNRHMLKEKARAYIPPWRSGALDDFLFSPYHLATPPISLFQSHRLLFGGLLTVTTFFACASQAGHHPLHKKVK